MICIANDLPKPTFANPTPDVPIEYSQCEAGADLLGFDLRFQDQPVTGPVPEFIVGIPTELNLQWVYRSTVLQDQQVVLRWKGSAAEVVRSFPINPEGWAIGGVFTQRISVDVPRFTHAGDGIFNIELTCPEDLNRRSILYVGPSMTHQIVTTSTFSSERIMDALGSTASRLKASFRLAAGSRVPITVKELPAKPCTAVAVISALQHSDKFMQDEPVMRLRVYGIDGAVQDIDVLAGTTTSLSEYDVPRPGTLGIRKAKIIESRPHPGDRTTWDGKPLSLHTYVDRLPLPTPSTLQRIEAVYLSDKGAIDVFDLVLLFE